MHKKDSHQFVPEYKFTDFVLFCFKSIKFSVCQKYPIKELHPDGKDSVWDAKKGFTIPTHLISYAGVVSCQTRIGNETFKSPLYIVAVVGKMESDSDPLWFSERVNLTENMLRIFQNNQGVKKLKQEHCLCGNKKCYGKITGSAEYKV